jgi:hypothetical protein
MTAPTKARKCKLCRRPVTQRYEVIESTGPTTPTVSRKLCADCARTRMERGPGLLCEPELPPALPTAPTAPVCVYCRNELDHIAATPTRRQRRQLCPRHRAEQRAVGWQEAAIALAIVVVLVLIAIYVH